MLYSLDYTERPNEIVDTWKKLDGYACRNYDRLLEKQTAQHENRVSARERKKVETLEAMQAVKNAYGK
jgi:hypothetical protein